MPTIDIDYIAKLSKLEIQASEHEAYERDIENILAFVDKLKSIDTHDIEPMSHPLDIGQRLRPDEITETNQREEFQAIAPLTEDGLYLVPKVIESE